ncbi:expressed unknown protein [Seminavis robusta]|uniref:Uncharacterized protein n=1 Tax=Seminavis robusta TaxID=568900 RepID=A0A9N8EBY7_9STRA|nr:expressed unknown protein [Seminavis robusta]|eukprot:Sro861_g212170.1 n/a (579) ;mRNA; f:6667-8403
MDKDGYVATIKELVATGAMADVSSAVKARVLAALHICSEHSALTSFLRQCEVTDIFKGLLLLDRPRSARQLRKKIQQIENEHPELIVKDDTEERCGDGGPPEEPTDEQKKRKRTRMIDVYRKRLKAVESELSVARCQSGWCCEHNMDSHIDTGVQEQIDSASVSGALARKVRDWAKETLKADFLEFVMLSLPSEPWRNVADLVHFKPGDFAVPYFLADVFGQKIPEDSFVAQMRGLAGNGEELTAAFLRIAESFPVQVRRQYSFLRTQPRLLAEASIVEYLAQHIPLETVLWFFEELYQTSRKCETILKNRLGNEEDALAESLQSNKSKATYGKLVERIFKFDRMRLKVGGFLMPLANRRLGELKERYSAVANLLRVAVFGDASASMQRAVEASTIFASMVASIFDGELSFFSYCLIRSPHAKPSNVEETMAVCHKIRANNCTSLAAALWPYYEAKKVMDLFVMVTDEMENTSWNGHRFASLLALYKREVNPNAQLIVVCVGDGDLHFRSSLGANGIRYKTMVIDGSRPDLTKFDSLLGQLAAMSEAKEPREGDIGEKVAEEDSTSGGPGSDDFVLVN